MIYGGDGMPAGGAKTKPAPSGAAVIENEGSAINPDFPPMTDEDVKRYEEALDTRKIELEIDGERVKFDVDGDKQGIRVLKEKLGVAPEVFMSSLFDKEFQKALSLNNGSILFDSDYIKVTMQGTGGDIYRTIRFNEASVAHDFFEISSKLQGKGIAKRMMANAYKTYAKLGLKDIEVHASLDGGGYAWAKYGFKPDSNTWRHVALSKLNNVKSQIPSKEMSSLKELLNSKDSKAIWKISDNETSVEVKGKKTTLGKYLLRGNSWHGKLDLQDKESVSRMLEYIKGGKKNG
jgi:GNAT superfamily N-acetyltransferase